MSLVIKVNESSTNRITVTLSGSIDSESAGEFEKVMVPLLKKEFSAIIFDFVGVTYITSSGLSVMVQTEKSIRARGKDLFVINIPPQIQKVLAVISALPSLKVFKDVDELDRYLIYLQNVQNGKNPS